MKGRIMELKQFNNVSRRTKLKRLKKIVEKALLNYDLDVDIVRFYAEHSNVMYSITTKSGEKYIMKIARPGDHNLPELQASNTWLSELHKLADFNALKPVETRKKELVIEVDADFLDEPRYCMIYEWLHGRNFSRKISIKNCYSWGKKLAKIHNLSEQLLQKSHPSAEIYSVLMKWDRVFYWDPEEIFSKKYEEYMSGNRRKLFKQGVEIVKSALADLYNSENTEKPIILHGDFHLDNIKVHQGKFYALDFEDAMWGYPVQDIAIALWYISKNKKRKVFYRAFQEGYSSLRKWPVKYPGEIEAFFIGRVLMLANFVIKCEDDDAEESMDYYEKLIKLHLSDMHELQARQ